MHTVAFAPDAVFAWVLIYNLYAGLVQVRELDLSHFSGQNQKGETVMDLGKQEVSIMVSDPWDWGTEFGCGPFSAVILRWKYNQQAKATSILLRLSEPKIFEGVNCEYFLASTRLEGSHLKDITQGKEVGCALTRIPVEQANSDEPFDLSWWRGGVGLMASICSAE